MIEFLQMLRSFMQTGGPVLWGILLLSVILWTLILERFYFFNVVYPRMRANWQKEWDARADKTSRRAFTIRRCIMSVARLELVRGIGSIKTLIALCPLLGLLGTVTGMIHVFDVLAMTGTGNARSMASGVSQATVPTMAGMVVAIAGLYFSKRAEDRVEDETRALSEVLHQD